MRWAGVEGTSGYGAALSRSLPAQHVRRGSRARPIPRPLLRPCSAAALRRGPSPATVERSSGRHHYRRLNRGGDRQANAALHRILQTRLRFDARTRDYYERRTKEGKTRREIVRCLNRHAAREVFHLVRPTYS
ncbi:IS110 family transposase [Streptomyces sp. NEAU-S7GS2]|uniref:IS110 family transposase n=1 Tax=Streptomyces sp. NEAU-S7GS2 TaxID=2202000 RepID=UPI001EF533FA|nr:IS110 family transposase [Streptomyces sp. NEAU-S7GS2]